METTEPQAAQPISPVTPQISREVVKSGIYSGPIKYIVILILGLIVLLILFLLLFPKKTPPVDVNNQPFPTVQISPSPRERQQSEFSQTEAFKQFEGRLESIRQEDEGVNLTETELAFPLLDMDVSFKNR